MCLERPDWKSFAIDSSLPATRIAHHNLGTAVTVVCGDLFTPFKPHPVFDFIVSNPPYIPSTIIKTLDSSVKDWEPHSALDGSDDGVLFYRAIAKNAGSYLKDGGQVYCEIGYDQAESVSDIFKTLAWENIHIYKDLGGNTRVVCAQKRQPTTSGG